MGSLLFDHMGHLCIWPHGIFNLLHLRPELLSLNQCHAAKYPVCEYGAVTCVGFLVILRI